MKESICPSEKCSGCGACEQVCPKNCISKVEKGDGSFYMAVDRDICIGCKKCEKVCPQLSIPQLDFPKSAYAAWAADGSIRAEGASGGVMSALYQYALDENMPFVGAYMDENFEVHFRVGKSRNDITEFKNSKYTFSHMDDIYKDIVSLLRSGQSVLFAGLPCQVAALKNYVGMFKCSGNLVTADIVCHGTPPDSYLKSHVKHIEEITGKKVKSVFFRDPAFRTDKFAFTVYSESIFEKTNLLSKKPSPTYKKYVGEGDMYQIGYHKGLIYRDCCYNCQFAQRQRVGDLTLGDYKGFGKYDPWEFSLHQTTCLLVNTDEGQRFIDAVREKNKLVLYKRNVLEPLEADAQFNHPSVRPPEREQFVNLYKKCDGDYDRAAGEAFKCIKNKTMLQYYLHIHEIRTFVMKLIPSDLKKSVKRLLKKN